MVSACAKGMKTRSALRVGCQPLRVVVHMHTRHQPELGEHHDWRGVEAGVVLGGEEMSREMEVEEKDDREEERERWSVRTAVSGLSQI